MILRPRRSWRLVDVGVFAGMLIALYIFLWLALHESPGFVAVYLPLWIWWIWAIRTGPLEIRTTGLTPQNSGGGSELGWDEITGLVTKRWGLARRRTEGLEVETSRLSGKPRRLFLPLSPCDPDWRSTPLLALLRQHRPELDVGGAP